MKRLNHDNDSIYTRIYDLMDARVGADVEDRVAHDVLYRVRLCPHVRVHGRVAVYVDRVLEYVDRRMMNVVDIPRLF